MLDQNYPLLSAYQKIGMEPCFSNYIEGNKRCCALTAYCLAEDLISLNQLMKIENEDMGSTIRRLILTIHPTFGVTYFIAGFDDSGRGLYTNNSYYELGVYFRKLLFNSL